MAESELQSQELETSVLGSIFVNENAAHHAFNNLTGKEFISSDIFRNIFNTAAKQYDKKYEVDKTLLFSYYETRKEESFKYKNAIKKCMNFCKPGEIETHCQKLRELHLRRKLNKEKMNFHPTDMSTPMNEIVSKLDDMADLSYEENPDIARTSAEIKEDASDRKPQLETGIHEWDSWFYENGGLGLGTTEIIFGRPGHGKTYYLFRKEGEIAKEGNLVLHFHLEDTAEEAANRIDAVIPPDEYHDENSNILVITEHRYLGDIIRDIRYYCQNYDIKAVGVDHIGRVKVRGFGAGKKNQAMIKASNDLTDLCNDIDVLGMFSAQPNKSYKKRKGWSNLLREEDLKYATELFEDAFVVTTLLRPNIYPELRTTGELPYGDSESKHLIEGPHEEKYPYNSLFLTQIKNRRQKLTESFLKMVQVKDKLYTLNEYKDNDNDVDLPF